MEDKGNGKKNRVKSAEEKIPLYHRFIVNSKIPSCQFCEHFYSSKILDCYHDRGLNLHHSDEKWRREKPR